MRNQLAAEGGFVTLHWGTASAPRHTSARVVHRASGAITAAVLPGPRPPVGEVVLVRATGGEWSARLVDAGHDQVMVTLPAWARAGNRRAAVRVPVSLDGMWCRVGDTTYHSAQIVDLSVTGARLVTEKDDRAPIVVGHHWDLGLPDGHLEVEVRGVSDDDFHPLLRMVGVRFRRPPADVALKIRDRVARGRGSTGVVPDPDD